MHVIDDKNDMFKDKPIDDRGVPEILFDIAAEVDKVEPRRPVTLLRNFLVMKQSLKTNTVLLINTLTDHNGTT